MKGNPLPDLADLNRWFRLDVIAGELLWKRRDDRLANWNARYPGTRAGSLNRAGYLHVNIGGVFVPNHRIVWKMTTGSDPSEEIDHINGDRKDNRPSNLREATAQHNRMNMRARGQWPKGVYRYHRDGSFRAQIKKDRKIEYLGMFRTPEEAHRAYRNRAAELFGEFACCDR